MKKDKPEADGKEKQIQKSPVEQKTEFKLHNSMMDQTQEFMGSLGGDAPLCDQCGHITIRSGTCFRCLNCGNSLGCS